MSWNGKKNRKKKKKKSKKMRIRFLVTSEYLLSMHDELSESVVFGQKLRYFRDQNGTKVEPLILSIFTFGNECYKQLLGYLSILVFEVETFS